MFEAISVIIPAHQAEPYIAEAVDSVLDQTRAACEIIVVSDDGQDYVQILAEHGVRDPRLRCIYTGGVGMGAAKARNLGFHAATGRTVVAIDSDDLLQSDALETFGQLVPLHGAVYSDHQVVDFASGAEMPNYNRPMFEGPITLAKVLTSHLHNYSCIAIDRQRLADLRWSEDLPFWEDLIFLSTCADALGTIYHTPRRLYTYRRRQGSLCNRPDSAAKFRQWALWILNALGQKPPLCFRNPLTEQTLRIYFRGQVALQTSYQALLDAGQQVDFSQHQLENLQLLSADPV